MAVSAETLPLVMTSPAASLAYTGAAGFSGTGLPLDANKLSNVFKRPIEIREIRFAVVTPLSTLTADMWFGGVIQAILEIAGHSVTQDYVPVGVLGSPQQPVTEAVSDAANVGTTPSIANYFRWVLPKPVVLPPETGVRGNIRLDAMNMLSNGKNGNMTTAFTAAVTTTVVGRYLDRGFKLPRTQAIPYATAWVGNRDGTRSQQLNLTNPFEMPLQVEKFVGRANEIVSATSMIDGAHLVGNITMRGASGCDIVGVPTPFDRVFDYQTRSLRVPHTLPRKGVSHQVFLRDVQDNYLWPIVSMIGYREVAV